MPEKELPDTKKQDFERVVAEQDLLGRIVIKLWAKCFRVRRIYRHLKNAFRSNG